MKNRDQYQVKYITSLYKEVGEQDTYLAGTLIKDLRRKVHVS